MNINDLDWKGSSDCLLKLNQFLGSDEERLCLYSVICKNVSVW
jgi:hypothetical protein